MPGTAPAKNNQEADQTSPRRTLLLVAVASFTVLCLGALALSRYLIATYDELDLRAAEQRGWQMLQALNAEAAPLDAALHDVAASDGAEAYVRTRAAGFIDAKFNASVLGNQRVDFVLLVDRNDRVLYSIWRDRDTQRTAAPAPGALLDYFLAQVGAAGARADHPAQSRVIDTAYGPALLSAEEVTRADGTQSTGAVLLYARFLKADELARVRRTSALDIGIRAWPGDHGDASGSLPGVLRDWADPATRNPLPVHVGEATIDSYTVLSSPAGTPTALLAVAQPREFHVMGVKTAWLLLGSVLALALMFGTILLFMVVRLQRSYLRHSNAEARYRNVAAQLGDMILMVDAVTHRVVEINDAVLNQLKYPREEVLARTARDIYPDLETGSLQQVANGESERNICISRVRRANGTHFDCEVSVTSVKDGTQPLLCLVSHDISHRKAAEEQQRANQKRLLHIAQHDPLTNLPNRLFLHAKLPRVIKHAADQGRQLALIYLDIDHFKNINDSRGHGFGDKLLQVIAQRLRGTIGSQDAVVRMGGDEFVIVASLITLDGTLDSLAQRLQAAIGAPIAIDGYTIAVTASIGVSVYPRDGLDLEVLLKHADIALYQAKESGRSCHRMFSADMDVRVSEDVALEQALRHAIGSDQFYMDYQPVVDINTNRVVSFEALMRWKHPEFGTIPPSRFVPVAEKSGLIVGLGQQAVEQVFRQLRGWLDAGLVCYPVNVNVAPHQLTRTDFPATVKELAFKTSMDVSWMRFEVTESAFLQNPEHMAATLQSLRDMGSHVLIDDFGTGYSALSRLAQLPVDALKIDRSFVVDLENRGPGGHVVTAVVDMARRLRLRTVAEGIETKRQAEALRNSGCDYGQGYLYSRPLSARRTRLLLEKITEREQQKRQLREQKVAS